MSRGSGERLIGVHEAALLLGVSGTHVRKLVRAGHIEEVDRVVVEGKTTIRLSRRDVERLARESWPGRR